MPKGKRTVEYTGHVPRAGAGKSPKLWAYGYSDLAKLLGTTEGALRARVARAKGGLDFGDLETVCRERDLRRSRLARKAGSLPGALALAPEASTIVIMPAHRESLDGGAMLCQHANEVPTVCPCRPKCYCRFNTCQATVFTYGP